MKKRETIHVHQFHPLHFLCRLQLQDNPTSGRHHSHRDPLLISRSKETRRFRLHLSSLSFRYLDLGHIMNISIQFQFQIGHHLCLLRFDNSYRTNNSWAHHLCVCKLTFITSFVLFQRFVVYNM